jgi:4'-phosphopantetheinyl transferase EntD
MFSCIKAVLFLFLGCSCAIAMAQSENSMQLPEIEVISQQRIALAEEKKIILDHFQEASKACWKQFAVNDCLFKAKQQKYKAMSPLDQREIALNARQRVLKEAERQQRISGKTQETSKDKAMP